MKMSHKIVDLEQYIVKTRYPYGHKPHRGVFKSTPSNGRPTLQSDRPNRIIIFRGCFNPPHVAHEALLRFAYEQSKDMNIIAAIVYPVDESSVKYKCQHQEGGLVFTKQERVRLWGGDEPHEWRWVFDQEHYGFGQFLARLKNSIIQDGFELEYATLIGPDHVHPGYVPRWDDWGCSTIITGNSGREAGFLTPYGELLRMLGAEEWKFISTNRREEQKEVSQKDAVKQVSQAISKLAFDENSDNTHEVEVWDCRSSTDHRNVLRSIVFFNTPNDISSTRIRHIIHTTHSLRIQRKLLDSLVLNPDLLAEMLRLRR